VKATVLALALLCAGAAVAQTTPATAPATAPNAAAHEARMMDNLATLLDLTDAQKPQVQAVLQAEHAKMKAQFEQSKASGTKPDFAQMKAFHQQLQADTLKQLTPVLSALQLKKFQVLSTMHGHMHGHHGPPPAGAAPPAAS
jgi:ABC-type glycerol-3-phosphate transport system substrate-binding protein